MNMAVASKSAEKSVKAFWEKLSPVSQSEKPWLNFFYAEKFMEFSYKDLLAQANCTAAFLLHEGIQKGDAIVIISSASPFYFVLDLALQYIGAVNISLPEHTETLRVGEIIKKHEAKYVFVEKPDIFLNYGQLAAYKNLVHGLVLCSEDVEDMDPDKLITFESLVNRGKSAWRENAEGLRDRKDSVLLSDTYSMLYSQVDERYFLDKVTFEDLVRKVGEAEEIAETRKLGSIASVMAPYRLIFRTESLFAPMIRRSPVYLLPVEVMAPGVMNQITVSALVADAKSIKELYEMIPQKFMGQNSSAHRTLNAAAIIYKKLDAAKNEGKKPPIMVRLRYSWIQKTLFRYIRKQLGGKMVTMLMGFGELEPKITDFFRHLGLEIHRIRE